jgi:hypothetical protein
MWAAHRLKHWLKNTCISAAYMGNRAQHVHRTAIFYGRKEHYSFNFLGALNRRTFMPCNNMLKDLLSFHDVDVPLIQTKIVIQSIISIQTELPSVHHYYIYY